jgi:hypothetical protein
LDGHCGLVCHGMIGHSHLSAVRDNADLRDVIAKVEPQQVAFSLRLGQVISGRLGIDLVHLIRVLVISCHRASQSLRLCSA